MRSIARNEVGIACIARSPSSSDRRSCPPRRSAWRPSRGERRCGLTAAADEIRAMIASQLGRAAVLPRSSSPAGAIA
jgi:hypothetical protein